MEPHDNSTEEIRHVIGQKTYMISFHNPTDKNIGFSDDIADNYPGFRTDVQNGPHSGHIATLSDVSGIDGVNYPSFIAALEQRRAFFKKMGAKATDHSTLTPYTAVLSLEEANTIFPRALHGQISSDDSPVIC